jgi:hypothetical protein
LGPRGIRWEWIGGASIPCLLRPKARFNAMSGKERVSAVLCLSTETFYSQLSKFAQLATTNFLSIPIFLHSFFSISLDTHLFITIFFATFLALQISSNILLRVQFLISVCHVLPPSNPSKRRRRLGKGPCRRIK